ncbi:MBL fold metallo-hydrolase, partial [Methyloceanibacter sp.]|uniref:MBL fold metallo-hydrolase n=1 Tax=Methyloceanibacter sp. TaxID=1965321 RepID=UPI00351BA408
KPIRYVINTHMHPDHVFGNAVFKEDAPAFVANHKLARGLGSRAERYLATSKRMLGDEAFQGIEVVLPTLAVDEKLSLDLGGRARSCSRRRGRRTPTTTSPSPTVRPTLCSSAISSSRCMCLRSTARSAAGLR